MKNKGFVWVGLVCFLVLVCLFGYITTSLAIGADSEHACSHDDCFVCLCVSLSNRVGVWQMAFAALIWLFVSGLCDMCSSLREEHGLFFHSTPVCWKVKLLN